MCREIANSSFLTKWNLGKELPWINRNHCHLLLEQHSLLLHVSQQTSHFHWGWWFKTDTSITSVTTNRQCLKCFKKAKISRVDAKAYQASKTTLGRPRLAFQTYTKLDATKYSHPFNQTNSSALTTAHHHPATGRVWCLINTANSQGIMEKGDLRRLVLLQWDRANTTVRNSVLLGPCRQYQGTFLRSFIQIGLKYLKKLSFNHFSWQKHLQAGTLQLQNQYLCAFFSHLIFQTVKLASWHKSLQSSLGAKLCPGLHLWKPKPVRNTARFQCSKSSANPSNHADTIPVFGTTEIQLQITCV